MGISAGFSVGPSFLSSNRAHFSLPFVRTIGDILKVRLGEYDVSTTAEPLRHEEFNISSIVIHPRSVVTSNSHSVDEFSSGESERLKLNNVLIRFNNSTLVHDIALLRLDRPAKRKQVMTMIMAMFMRSMRTTSVSI